MKYYPKEYEDVFTAPRSLKKCKIEEITIDEYFDLGGLDEYIDLFRSTVFSYQQFLFDYWVKIGWLIRRFGYRGIHRIWRQSNSHAVDSAFGVFMRKIVGFDGRFITRYSYFSAISGYFLDFFPDFDTSNPFKTHYVYPYKTLGLESLVMVYQMTERLELLKYGDEQAMEYIKFLDYMVNYVNCFNEEAGEEVYRFIFSDLLGMPYVKNLKRKRRYEVRRDTKT